MKAEFLKYLDTNCILLLDGTTKKAALEEIIALATTRCTLDESQGVLADSDDDEGNGESGNASVQRRGTAEFWNRASISNFPGRWKTSSAFRWIRFNR